MGDNYPANISIGGKVSKSLREDLIKHICAEGLPIGSSEEYIVARLIYDIQAGAYLELDDDDARYGIFKGLEEWLRDNHIDYDRHSEAYSTFDAEVSFCRDGERFHFYSTQVGEEILIQVRSLQGFVDKYKGLVDTCMKSGILVSVVDVGVMLEELQQMLCNVPVLAPFEWVD